MSTITIIPEPTIYCTRREHDNHYTRTHDLPHSTWARKLLYQNPRSTTLDVSTITIIPEPTIYRTRREHDNHYTTDSVGIGRGKFNYYMVVFITIYNYLCNQCVSPQKLWVQTGDRSIVRRSITPKVHWSEGSLVRRSVGLVFRTKDRYRTVLNWFNILSFIKLSKRSKILILTSWLSSGLSRFVVGCTPGFC